MNLHAIHHESGGAYAYPIEKDRLALQLRSAKDDLSAVTVLYGDRYSTSENSTVMTKYASDLQFDYWRTVIRVPARKFRYHFALQKGNDVYWYNELGFSRVPRRDLAMGYFLYPMIAEPDRYQIPAWVDDAVVYQIFPDRFARAGQETAGHELLPWGAEPTEDTDFSFFGGDLRGIRERLPYLKNLGINVIYLNPVFAAETCHRYDVMDYKQVAPLLGGNEAFRELSSACHELGIRVIVDMVLNHCGHRFAPFRDALEKGRKSPYWDWFFIHQHPVDTKNPAASYECFGLYWKLPKLRLSNPGLREYIFDMTRFWIEEMGVDGFRLDAANEVEHVFWRDFRRHVHSLKKDFLLVGEVWDRGISFLQGDQFDGITNYHFSTAVFQLVVEGRLSVTEFDALLTQNRVSLPEHAVRASWTMLDSHDTKRFQSSAGGDVTKLKLAATLQLTAPGVPCIYYGTELGLGKHADGMFIRRSMDWREENWDRSLLEHYRRLLALRKEHQTLRTGQFRTLWLDPVHELHAYAREGRFNRVVVLCNFGSGHFRQAVTAEKLGFDPQKPVKNLFTDQVIPQGPAGLMLDLPRLESLLLAHG